MKKEHDLEIQHVKLVAETERLNLKSEFEVKYGISIREKEDLIEDKKRLQLEKKEEK